jgi:hypothetical protein
MTTTDRISQIRAAHPPMDGRAVPAPLPTPFYAVGGLDPDFAPLTGAEPREGLLARLRAGFRGGGTRSA